MNFKRQSGWFSLEALISLFLVSIITTAAFHWQQHSYQQSRNQIAQIQRLQAGSSLLELMIGLLLMSMSVIALCHTYLIVQQTRFNLTDDLRQQRTAVLFYLALEPYLENALYAGCDPSNISLPTRIAIYSPTDSIVPIAIRQKAQSQILFLNRIRETVQLNSAKHHLHIGDQVIVDHCDHAELNQLAGNALQLAHPSTITKKTVLHHLENCWIYLAESQFHYRNGKAMHTVFAACDHQPPNPIIRGIANWQIELKSQAILFDWESESALEHSGLHWHSKLQL